MVYSTYTNADDWWIAIVLTTEKHNDFPGTKLHWWVKDESYALGTEAEAQVDSPWLGLAAPDGGSKVLEGLKSQKIGSTEAPRLV